MTISFPKGWALQKPQQTIDPEEFEAMWRAGQMIITRKRDGNRAHVVTAGVNTRVFSRNGTLDLTSKLPHIVDYYARAPEGLLIDCELHTADEGTEAFQAAMNDQPADIRVSAFDMLDLGGKLARLGYEDRSAQLSALETMIGRPENVWGGGVAFDLDPGASYERVLQVIEDLGIEGFVGWRRDAPHALNLNGNTKRGQCWKIKVRKTEDLIAFKVNAGKNAALGCSTIEVARTLADGQLQPLGKIGSFEAAFDRHAALSLPGPFVVEVSHYGVDDRSNLMFAKVIRARPDLHPDFKIAA